MIHVGYPLKSGNFRRLSVYGSPEGLMGILYNLWLIPLPMATFPPDDVFAACANESRRVGLRTVCEQGSCSIEDLVDTLARDTGQAPSTVRLQLYHNHLPKLQGLGLITYDWDRDMVHYDASCDREQVLEIIDGEIGQLIFSD